jgi:hypothetical protein
MKKYSSIRVSFVQRPTSSKRTSKKITSRNKINVISSSVSLYQITPTNDQQSHSKHIKQCTANEQDQSSSIQNQQSNSWVSSDILRSHHNLIRVSQLHSKIKTIREHTVELFTELHLDP